MTETEARQWQRLREPFPTTAIKLVPQSISKDKTRALAVAYIDAREVMDRLDAVLGSSLWSFVYELRLDGGPMSIWSASTSEWITVNKAVCICNGHLSMMGNEYHDVGALDGFGENQVKGAVSDALKRCAVRAGIGRYLYGLTPIWADWDDSKRKFVDADTVRAQILDGVPIPTSQPARSPASPQSSPSPVEQITDTIYCPTHGLTYRREGKGNYYCSHRDESSPTSFCQWRLKVTIKTTGPPAQPQYSTDEPPPDDEVPSQ